MGYRPTGPRGPRPIDYMALMGSTGFAGSAVPQHTTRLVNSRWRVADKSVNTATGMMETTLRSYDGRQRVVTADTRLFQYQCRSHGGSSDYSTETWKFFKAVWKHLFPKKEPVNVTKEAQADSAYPGNVQLPHD